MTDTNLRMTDQNHSPSEAEVEEWVGKEAFRYWKQVTDRIEERYPGIFVPEWLFGGRKHGWSLRYKKSKSFCTLIPEKNRFSLVIVLGTKEREKVEAIRDGLQPDTRTKYDRAATYHDGKWLLLSINSNKIIEDVMQMLAVKRKPQNKGNDVRRHAGKEDTK